MNPTLKIMWIVLLAVFAVVTMALSQLCFKYSSDAFNPQVESKAPKLGSGVVNPDASSDSQKPKINLKRAIFWFLVAGAAGTVAMILYTLLLRFVPLSVGYAILFGFGFVVVQVVAAKFILKESVSLVQWLGSAVLVAGIFMIAFGGEKG